MNFADSEIVASILIKDGYTITKKLDKALILINTCQLERKLKKQFAKD